MRDSDGKTNAWIKGQKIENTWLHDGQRSVHGNLETNTPLALQIIHPRLRSPLLRLAQRVRAAEDFPRARNAERLVSRSDIRVVCSIGE